MTAERTVPPGTAPAGTPVAGTGGEEGSPRRRAVVVRALLGALVALVAVELAVVECFLVPLRVGTVPLPVSVPLALAGNVVLPRLAARLTGRAAAAVAPPVLWLAVVLVLSAPRAEGDVVVPGTLTGLVFLFGGSVAGAYGAASTIARRRPGPARPTRG